MKISRTLPAVALPFAVLALAGACGSDEPASTSGDDGGGAVDGSMANDGSGTTDGQSGTDGSAGNDGTTGTDSAGGDGSMMSPGESVLMHHKNPTRDGVYIQPTLTKAAAATLTKDAAFAPVVDGQVYAQPLFVDGGTGGTDLVIVATQKNNVYAFSATDGHAVWTKSLGTAVPQNAMQCGNITTFGVTSTPVIDLATRSLYVGAIVGGNTPKYQVFALSLDDGSVRTGWPVDMEAKAHSGNTSFASTAQSQRGALALINGTLYVPFGGLYGDCGTYHGWMVGITASDPTQVTAWATGANAGGAWAPSGVASDGTNVFITTGNTSNTNGTWSGGEAIIKFAAGSALATPSYWSPTNWLALDNGDVDVGGTGAVVFDLAGSTPSKLIAAFGKDGNVYLNDRTNLGGIVAPVAQFSATSNQIINASAAYTTETATYLTFRGNGKACAGGTSGGLTTVKVLPGSPPTLQGSWCANGGAGSPMVTTTDGHANAIVWTFGAEGDNKLHGFDGDTGAAIFTGPTMTGLRKFNTPIAAKGRIYVPTDTTVVAYKL